MFEASRLEATFLPLAFTLRHSFLRWQAFVFFYHQTSTALNMTQCNTPFRPIIVIPALNAAKTLPKLLNHLAIFNTLVIDDGSEDDTFILAEAAASVALQHGKNQGHSAAIMSGENYAAANGYTHILLLDSDGQHPPEYAQKAIDILKLHDLVVGDRFESLTDIPIQKIASNLFASLLIQCATGYFLRDVSCGFRGYWLYPELKELTAQGYSRVYSQIINALVQGKRIGRVSIPAIYPPSQKLLTRSSEVKGLCLAILNIFPENEPALYVMSALRECRSFEITFENVMFNSKTYDLDENYCFYVDQNIARRLYGN